MDWKLVLNIVQVALSVTTLVLLASALKAMRKEGKDE